ncbi:MAG: hypothetical protein JOZ38_02505 [Candidatus Eremiobacteraeota bacterium]|nr:hypothetical protein [Candidatus Eremiobacteraeota bacterium]
MVRFLRSLLTLGLLGALCAPAYAAASCTAAAPRHVAALPHGRLNACVVRKGRIVVEMTYYQNASKVGGTALAAYPEMRVRYGIARNIELSFIPPSEIAKSNLAGRGTYMMTKPGFGVKLALGRWRGADLSVAADYRPPMNPLANTLLVPSSAVHVDATWSPAVRALLNAEVGILNYSMRDGRHGSSFLEAVGFTMPLNRKTAISFDLGTQLKSACGAGAQNTGVLGLTRMLGAHLLGTFEIGTAFNPSGGSKAHYIAFAFSSR